MRRRAVECVGPSYVLPDRKAAVQRAVNLYVEESGPGEDKRVYLRSAPGLRRRTPTSGVTRGVIDVTGRLFIVAGSQLQEIDTAIDGSWVTTTRGALSTSTGFVGMAYGRDQLVIVDGANGYVFNLTSGAFAQITSPGWRGSNTVQYLDGYFIFVDPQTEQFYISAPEDAATFDELDFSSADTSPDDISAQIVFKRELYLFGSGSTEVWVNSGNPDFPLTRYNATPIQVGAVGPYAACIAADSVFLVGQTDRGRGIVYRLAAYSPERVSTQAVEEELALCTDWGAIRLWAYQVPGHEFVCLEAPGLPSTWVFDAATQQWHERAQLVDGEYKPLEVTGCALHGGAHVLALRLTLASFRETEYSIDANYGEDVPMPRERTWPHLVAPEFDPVSFHGLELACSTGAGGNVTLEISNDGGHTWGPPLLRSLGVVGRYMQRIRWLMLGAGRDRVFRLKCTDSVPFNIHGATVDA